jgi:UDP-N-acetylmuramoyl-tripeptide--D-alanyl-D-alanine ligase
VGRLSRSASSAFGLGASHFESQQDLIDALQSELSERKGHALRVLVKGSRSSAMDKVVSALLANNRGDTGHAA